MRLFILAGLALMLVLCACQNTLDIGDTELGGVQSSVLLNRHLLKDGDDYTIGYTNGNILSDRVTLSWTRCTDEDFLCYKLFRDDDHIRDIISPAITGITDSLLQQNHVYDYRLVCFLKNGMAVDDTIQIKTPQFQPPNQLDYTTPAAGTLILTWNNRAESAAFYNIEKHNITQDILTTHTSTTESWTDTAVSAMYTYRYRVQAANQYEVTGWSPWIYQNTSLTFDFEDSDGGFESNSALGWQWGVSSYAGANSGTNIWGTVLEGSYPFDAFFTLTSPLMSVPEDAVLQFYHGYQMEYGWDGGNVKISTNGGASWALITPVSGYTNANIQSSGEPGFSGVFYGWNPVTFDLSAYAGMNVMFMWTFTSDNSVNGQGWFIDDVRVGLETDMNLVR